MRDMAAERFWAKGEEELEECKKDNFISFITGQYKCSEQGRPRPHQVVKGSDKLSSKDVLR